MQTCPAGLDEAILGNLGSDSSGNPVRLGVACSVGLPVVGLPLGKQGVQVMLRTRVWLPGACKRAPPTHSPTLPPAHPPPLLSPCLQEEDSRKIAQLLKHGAHCLQDLGAANEASGAFAAEGIDQILQVGAAAAAGFCFFAVVVRLLLLLRLVAGAGGVAAEGIDQILQVPPYCRRGGVHRGWEAPPVPPPVDDESCKGTQAVPCSPPTLASPCPHPTPRPHPQGRTEKRQIGGRAGNSFSVATFAVSGAGGAGSEVRCSRAPSLLLPPLPCIRRAAGSAARAAPRLLM